MKGYIIIICFIAFILVSCWDESDYYDLSGYVYSAIDSLPLQYVRVIHLTEIDGGDNSYNDPVLTDSTGYYRFSSSMYTSGRGLINYKNIQMKLRFEATNYLPMDTTFPKGSLSRIESKVLRFPNIYLNHR